MTDGQVMRPSTEPLRRLSFSSATISAGDAFEAWRSWFGHLNDIVPAEDAPFHASVDYFRVGRFVVGSNVSSRMRLHRSSGQARRDGLDDWVLRVSRKGVVRSRSGDATYVSRPGDVVLERLSRGYEDEWSADEWTAVIFPPDVFPEIDRTLESLGAGPLSGMKAKLLADYILGLDRILRDLTRAEEAAVARATRELIAALSPDERIATRGSAVTARLRAERVIRENLASARLDAKRIAALSGVSRATLYRMFDEVGGVAAHVRRLRLDAVHAALRDPAREGQSISGIAAETGFHCVASFNRAFKSRFGASPGELRAAERAATADATATAEGAGSDFIDRLFPRGA